MDPLAVYMSNVRSGHLTEDEYQKKIVSHLNNLHQKLLDYRPPPKTNKFLQKVGIVSSTKYKESSFWALMSS